MNTLPISLDSNRLEAVRRSGVIICASPKAGTGAGREGIAEVIARLEQLNIRCEMTTCIQRVRERMQQATQDPDCLPVLVCGGGDGTLSLIAQNTPRETVLVPMPLGTENLVAKHYGHAAHPKAVVATVVEGHDRRIDAGEANGKLFLVMATCGFDAEVVRAMHLTRRGHINRFSYAGPIARTLSRYRFPNLQVQWFTKPDATILPGATILAAATEPAATSGMAAWQPAATDDVHQCRWAMVFNLPRYAASLGIEPYAQDDDGRLDFCGLEYGSLLSGIRYLGGIAVGRHIHWQDVKRVPIWGCRISSTERVSYQLDGDYAGRLPVQIRVVPQSITLRLPPARKLAP